MLDPIPGTASSRRARDAAWRVRGSQWARGLAGVVAFLIIAQGASYAGILNRSLLPSAFTVLGEAAGLLTNGQFLGDMLATLEGWAIGLALTVAVGVPLGVVLGSLPGVRTATRTVVEFLRPIPSVALIPLVGIIIGPGVRMAVTLIVYAAIWPVLFNTIYGLDDVDPVAKDTLRAFGFSRFDVIRRVSLPSAAPFIATGIRLASSIAIILDIATGILTGQINGPGIGAFIAEANNAAGNTGLVLAATLWTGILAYILNALIVSLEKRAFRWHHAYSLDQV